VSPSIAALSFGSSGHYGLPNDNLAKPLLAICLIVLCGDFRRGGPWAYRCKAGVLEQEAIAMLRRFYSRGNAKGTSISYAGVLVAMCMLRLPFLYLPSL
jgi:hypothetical protein